MQNLHKEFITLKLTEIFPYENNPRINDNAVNDVLESIKQCEYIDPIEIDEDNIILSGHTRLKALKKLKRKTCDCIRISGLSPEQKKKYRLLTNKTGESALWDFEKLDMELDDLDFGDYDFGFEENFTIDDLQDLNGYSEEKPDNPNFEIALVFPRDKKKEITQYMKAHKADIISDIIRKAGE